MSAVIVRAREARGPSSAVALEQSPDVLALHLEDAAHYPGGHADAIARPRTEREVAALVMAASRVLAIGAQSSVTGGATPDGGLLLSTERMTACDHLDATHVRVGAGLPLVTLQQQLQAHRRWFPPVPTFTGAFAGGAIATNAAGAATYKYGATRPWVNGLTVVLACGDVLDLARGSAIASAGDHFEVVCAHGTRTVRPGTYRRPNVPKCSAGYFAADVTDFIDLFIGAEGTLGIIVDATLRVLRSPPAVALALIPVPTEAAALALVGDLRNASERTWTDRDARGIDVCAIESMDRRCLEILREDGADRRNDLAIPDDAAVALIVQLELPAGTDPTRAYDEIAAALDPDPPDTPLVRFCRLLDRHGLLDGTELALPGDTRRADQLIAVREAVPTGVNRRIGDAKRDVDPRIEKTAGDMIVPFERFGEMMSIYRDGFGRRGLDFAIWGHVSDGNVHPNVLPRTYDDVVAAKEAMLEFGRETARLGGCPLAEHGVGRSPIKQQLLRQMYGDAAIEEMRAIKRALDPEWKLAPGVLFQA